MNTMVLRHGRECIVVDAGMMFPSADHPGVDTIVPDLSALDAFGTLHGVVLTHGHEDHIGGLSHLLARHDIPVYGAPHARELVRRRLGENGIDFNGALRELPSDGEFLKLGPFAVRPHPTSHSIPQAKMLQIDSPAGTLLHTGDFKLNPAAPHAGGADLDALRDLGDRGVLALLSDSTNAMEPGVTPGEIDVVRGIDPIVASATGRVLVTCFASNMDRVATVARIAARHGRKLGIVGGALESQVDVAERLGILRFTPGTRERIGRLMGRAASKAVLLVAGTQNEPGSALRRIVAGNHSEVSLSAGDVLIHSARTIPGNEKSIGRLIDAATELGVRVVTRRDAPVHVSGHPARDELTQLIDCIRPRYLIPVHGEYRHLDAHASLAVDHGMDADSVKVMLSGDLVALSPESIETVDQIETGSILLDSQRQVIDPGHLSERRTMGNHGIVIPVVTVGAQSGKIAGSRIVTRGFAASDSNGVVEALEAVLTKSLGSITNSGRADAGSLEDRIRADLRRHLRRRMGRRPLVLPLIVESDSS